MYYFERKINYYETDKMGVVHHSNYIRFLEEARCDFMHKNGMPYSQFESKGVMIPVLHVDCSYKYHVTYDDSILINVFIKDYSGVRLTIGYNVKDKKTDRVVINAETRHCFTSSDLKPINLKKYLPDASEMLESLKSEYKNK